MGDALQGVIDNNRQMMSLEDQLLQNRISTDASLSGSYQAALQNRATGLAGQANMNSQNYLASSNVYQGALQNRATGLNTQANQNMSHDNAIRSGQLGYIGGIQENMNGFNSVANLYSQGFQMDNANEQARLQMDNSNQQARLQMNNANQQAKYNRALQMYTNPQQNVQAGRGGGYTFAVNAPY